MGAVNGAGGRCFLSPFLPSSVLSTRDRDIYLSQYHFFFCFLMSVLLSFLCISLGGKHSTWK